MSDTMKTDRELLELAAKAAGYAIEWREWITSRVEAFGAIKHTKHKGFWLDDKQWNPLADDGDALRLAVKLGMIIDARYTKPESIRYNRVTYWLTPSSGLEIEFGDSEMDICAATRRAITRAAAAIGEGMK